MHLMHPPPLDLRQPFIRTIDNKLHNYIKRSIALVRIIVNNMRCVSCRDRIEKELAEAGIYAEAVFGNPTVALNEKDADRAVAFISRLGYEFGDMDYGI